MDLSLFQRDDEYSWRIAPHGAMRVPGIIYATEQLIHDMDDKVYQQLCNVAMLPGIVEAAYAMPDAHWGYGFPIGGVAAFDADQGGVISAGGVGFDISCGVRALRTGLARDDILGEQKRLVDQLYRDIPAGLGSQGALHLNMSEMDAMLKGGARWAVQQGFGEKQDLARIEEHGCMPDAQPDAVSERAKRRQQDEMGTLGSGNHYLEVQVVTDIYDTVAAAAYGLQLDDVVISIHCGSRGLGHQIGTDYLRDMVMSARDFGIHLPDRELACAPINSTMGQNYLGAMRAGINCALANRQIITHLVRESFQRIFPNSHLDLLYDVSHNTCKQETHTVNGQEKTLYVHRKGATRAFGPGHSNLPDSLQSVGQPVIIGGSMGTHSYILAGNADNEQRAFSSACHGAGRAMSRRQATRQWHGRELINELESRGILIRSPSLRGVAEEAPGAYKDVSAVVLAAEQANLARRVVRLAPLVCVKG
ncbi:MAG: RtcB family protein [Thiohalophilus sp.]|jgi:tRNA-splicing ligase RtcB